MTPLTKYEIETIVNYGAGDQTEIDKSYSMPKTYITYRKSRKLSDG